jgi:hypothetical protein
MLYPTSPGMTYSTYYSALISLNIQSLAYETKFTFRGTDLKTLHFLKACDFVAQHGHLNCYQANIQKPEYGMLSQLPEQFNPLNPKLNPICSLLALLGAHHFLHVSRIGVKSLTLRLLLSYIYIYIYIYGAPILHVSRSHTTTHHSR